MTASTTPPGAAPTPRADRSPAPAHKSGHLRGSVVPLAPYRAARATNDPEMLAALAQWATPEAYLPDLAEQLRESVLPQRPVVTLGAKMFVGAVWVALAAYCIAIWMGAAK